MKKNSTFFSGDYLLWRSCLQKEKQKNPQGNEKISELALLQDKASTETGDLSRLGLDKVLWFGSC